MGEFVRVYFCGRPIADEFGNFVSRGMYADLVPGKTFKILKIGEFPILELGNLGEFDEFGTYPISVIRKFGSYYAFYGGWSRPKAVPFDVAIGLATSNDGEKFTKYGNGPIFGASPKEPFVITSPKIRYFNQRFLIKRYHKSIKIIMLIRCTSTFISVSIFRSRSMFINVM